MDVPPSRYKVVEEGRRLVVLDRWNGNTPVAGHMPLPKLPGDSAHPATVEQARAALRPGSRPRPDGMAKADPILTTQSWYDDQAPRRIRIGSDGQGALIAAIAVLLVLIALIWAFFTWFGVVIAGFALLQPGVRKMLRAAITPMLGKLGERID